MPQLLRSLSRFSLFRRVPIPTLKNYMVVSTILSIGVFYHTYRTVTSDDWKDQNEQPTDNENGTQLSPGTQQLLNSSLLFKILYVLVTDQTTVWVVVNSVCCAAATFGWVLRWFVFGRLRVQETQQLRDRFWNFVFHKFVFVFGVLNATYVDEVVLWTFWFMSVGLVYLLTSLAQDRFKYMSSAAPASNPSVQYRLVVMASCCCLAALGLLVVSIAGWYKFGAHYGLFLMAEAIMLLIRASYCTFRYAAYLYDLKNESAWEQRNSIIYYAEFAFEVSVAIIDLFHHIHMLVWGQIVLSMASLVMIMQIRYIYQKIDQRLRRHKNYKRITLHMDMHYPMAGAEDLALLEDPCAICWDRMEAARKLPCGHFFHNWCLRGWLEQDTSCPTCRMALAVGGQPVRDDHHVVPDAAGVDLDFTEQANSRRFNHFFHFDGRRYARWLPSFSVEVSHNLGASAFFQGRPPLTDSQLNTMAEQVREMFPQMPLSLIIEDLRETGASQATVENILEGRLMGEGGVSSADESGTEFDDESSDASDGHNLTNNMTSERPAASSVSAATSTRTRGASATLSDFFFRRSRTTTAASDGDAPSHLQQPSTSANPFALPSPEAAAVSLSTGVIVGGRFSKSSDEREIILNERKRALIDVHRRRYLASERGDDIRHLFPHENGQSMSSSGDAGDFSLPASSGLIRRAIPRPD